MLTSATQHIYILAAGAGGGKAGAESFFDSSIGQTIQHICGAVAIIVLLAGVFMLVRDILKGKPGSGIKILVFCVIGAALLFKLDMFIGLVQTFSGIIKNLFSSFGDISK